MFPSHDLKGNFNKLGTEVDNLTKKMSGLNFNAPFSREAEAIKGKLDQMLNMIGKSKD